jgi:hypothetical protein
VPSLPLFLSLSLSLSPCIPQEISSEDSAGDTVDDSGEILLWAATDDTPLELPGFEVFHPEEISKVVRLKVEHNDDQTRECGSTTVVVVYDKNGDLMVAAVDDFFAPKVLDQLISTAVDVDVPGAPAWDWAHIHPDNGDPSDLRKGNGFPGRRAYAKPETSQQVIRCLKPIMAKIDPGFNLDRPKDLQTL